MENLSTKKTGFFSDNKKFYTLVGFLLVILVGVGIYANHLDKLSKQELDKTCLESKKIQNRINLFKRDQLYILKRYHDDCGEGGNNPDLKCEELLESLNLIKAHIDSFEKASNISQEKCKNRSR